MTEYERNIIRASYCLGQLASPGIVGAWVSAQADNKLRMADIYLDEAARRARDFVEQVDRIKAMVADMRAEREKEAA